MGRRPRTQEPLLAQLGSTGFKRSTTTVIEEWHPVLTGTRAVKVYREMMDNDSNVGAALNLIEDLIRQATWEFVSPDESSAEGKEWADLVNGMMADMESTWQEMLSDIMLMLPFGWALFVDTYKIRRGESVDARGQPVGTLYSQHDDGLYGWRDISIRAQETLWEWDFDEATSKTLGMWQMAPPYNRTTYIPLHRALLFRLRTSKGNPAGRSGLRSAFRPWFMLKRIQEIEAVGIERDLAGMPVMEVPPSIMAPNADTAAKALRKDYEEKIQKVRLDQLYGMVIPAEIGPDGKPTGYKFRLVNSGGRRPSDADVIVKRYGNEILRVLAAEFLPLGQEKVGSFALHSDKTAMLSFRLGAIMDTICEVICRGAIPRLMRLNGVDQRLWPVLEHGDVEREKASEVVTAFQTAAQAGLVVPTDEDEAHVRGRLDWPQRGAEDIPRAPGQPQPGAPTTPVQLELGLDTPPADPGEDGPDFWTAEEVATKLGVSRATVNGAIKRRQLPGIKVGNSFRVSRKDAEKLWSGGVLR